MDWAVGPSRGDFGKGRGRGRGRGGKLGRRKRPIATVKLIYHLEKPSKSDIPVEVLESYEQPKQGMESGLSKEEEETKLPDWSNLVEIITLESLRHKSLVPCMRAYKEPELFKINDCTKAGCLEYPCFFAHSVKERRYFRACVTCPFLAECKDVQNNKICEFRHTEKGMLTPFEICSLHLEEQKREAEEERKREEDKQRERELKAREREREEREREREERERERRAIELRERERDRGRRRGSGDGYGSGDDLRLQESHFRRHDWDQGQPSSQWKNSNRESGSEIGTGSGMRSASGILQGSAWETPLGREASGRMREVGAVSGGGSASGIYIDRTGDRAPDRDAFIHEGQEAPSAGFVRGQRVDQSSDPARTSFDQSPGDPAHYSQPQPDSLAQEVADGTVEPFSPTADAAPPMSPPRTLVRPVYTQTPADYSPTQDPAMMQPRPPGTFELAPQAEQTIGGSRLLHSAPPPAPATLSVPTPAPEREAVGGEDDWVARARKMVMDVDGWREYEKWSLSQGGDDALAFKLVRDLVLSPNVGLSGADLSCIFELQAALPAESYEEDCAMLESCDIPRSELNRSGSNEKANKLSPAQLSSLDRLGTQLDIGLAPIYHAADEDMGDDYYNRIILGADYRGAGKSGLGCVRGQTVRFDAGGDASFMSSSRDGADVDMHSVSNDVTGRPLAWSLIR